MAGSSRFELSSGNPEEPAFAANHPNGQRGNCSGPNLYRSGSFRDGIENRMLSSGSGSGSGSGSSSRGNTNFLAEMRPPLSQGLMLEPILMGDQKFTRSGELRRIMGVSLGTASEDHHSFGATAHSRPPHPIATDELKRFKASVQDTSIKARDRGKMLNESIAKLDKQRRTLISRKQQRSDLVSRERSGGSNLLKMGSQIHQNPPDIVGQRMEDRAKNVVPNKRARTLVAEERSEGRTTALLRQPMALEKDRDILRAGSRGSVQVEEKICGLPAGGEGWDKKMKKKRSVGTVVNRTMDGDRDIKRPMHQKFSNDPRSRSCDAQVLRSGPSNGIGIINKLDGTSQSAILNARTISSNGLESVSLPSDSAVGLDKRRGLAKENNKLSICEGNQVGSPRPVTKGKASRAPRAGSGMVASSSPNFTCTSVAFDVLEQRPSLNKVQSVGGANNRKRSLPSSSPPVAQWVGKRQQKSSRTRRANLVSPVSNSDETQISSEGFSASDIGARLAANDASAPLLGRGVSPNSQQFKENVPSPARLSESEELEVGEKILKEKGMENCEVEDRSVNAVLEVRSFLFPAKKNRILVKEKIGDGVRRQGRSGRGSLLSRTCVPPMRERSENPTITKPLRSTRTSSDKNESKLGRPLSKKLSDRKAFTRSGHVLNNVSSDFAGESDDDHEQLLSAASSAHNASYLACSGSFWKKMEPIFASVSSEDTTYLKQQLNFIEELDESLSHMFGDDDDGLGELVHKEVSLSQDLVSGERRGCQPIGIRFNKSAGTVGLLDQLQGSNTLCGRLDIERRFDKVTPLYQRVLSALIGEDEDEEFDHDSERRNLSFQYASDDSHCATCIHIDIEPKDGDMMGSEIESEVDLSTHKQSFLESFSCDGSTTSNGSRSLSICSSIYNDELWQGDNGLVQSEVGIFSGFCQSSLDGPQTAVTNISGMSSFERQYQQMCLDEKLVLELKSVGLYPETVPDLTEGEEEEINTYIVELKKGFYRQVGKKRGQLWQIAKAIQNRREMEGRDIELVAMNKLIEMAYKKHLACRGSNASKSGVSKVSKQAVLAFVKRTLARCQKFEDTERSCFSEPALRDVIFSAPPCSNDVKSSNCVGETARNMLIKDDTCQTKPSLSAMLAPSGMVERHAPPCDKLDRGSSDAFQAPTHSSDQAFDRHEPLSNRGKKKEVLLGEVVGNAASRGTSALGNILLSGAKGKRSERERDHSQDMLTRYSVAKAGRSSLGSVRGERKTKTKAKQKTAQLSTSGNGLLGRLTEAKHTRYPSVHAASGTVTNGSSKASGEVRLQSTGTVHPDLSKETEEPIDYTNLQEHALDSIEDLGISGDLGGHQDLSSWLNFDEDGLQDHDSVGLEIPMDDLSELNMLM